MKARQPCTVVPYAAEHLEDVSLIDRLCFIDPWFKRSFMEELSADCALNLVAVSPMIPCTRWAIVWPGLLLTNVLLTGWLCTPTINATA